VAHFLVRLRPRRVSSTLPELDCRFRKIIQLVTCIKSWIKTELMACVTQPHGGKCEKQHGEMLFSLPLGKRTVAADCAVFTQCSSTYETNLGTFQNASTPFCCLSSVMSCIRFCEY